MAEYSFITTWKFNSPINRVWDEIFDPGSWPEWWNYVDSTREIKKGDKLGIGSLWDYTWKTRLFYKFSFTVETTVVEPPCRLVGNASGDLEGTGIWTLTQEHNSTKVIYVWNVKTNKSWMNILAPLAYPFFKWNHTVVMDNGYKGLKTRLNNTK